MSQGAKVVSLAHIKAVSAPPPPVPTGPQRIAWAGGKITSNKEEAMLAFLRRKQKQGGLNDEQKAILQKLAEEEHGAHKATVQTGSGEVAKAHEVYGGEAPRGNKKIMLRDALKGHHQDDAKKLKARADRFKKQARWGGGGRYREEEEEQDQMDVSFTIMVKEPGAGGGLKRRLGPPVDRGGRGPMPSRSQPAKRLKGGGAETAGRGGGKAPGAVPLEKKLGMSLDQLMKVNS